MTFRQCKMSVNYIKVGLDLLHFIFFENFQFMILFILQKAQNICPNTIFASDYDTVRPQYIDIPIAASLTGLALECKRNVLCK